MSHDSFDKHRQRMLELYADGYSCDEIGKIVAEECGRPVQYWAKGVERAVARWVNEIDQIPT